MFAVFSNRLGCVGSLVVSLFGTLIVVTLCTGFGPSW